MEDRPVTWKRRVTSSMMASNTPIPLAFVEELEGVVLRCGNCGQVAASLRRKKRMRGEYTWYTHCRACDKEQRLGGELGARNRVAEADPQAASSVFGGG